MGKKENNEKNEKKKEGFESIFEAFAFIPQVSLSLAVPVFLGALAGNWLDNKAGTGSIFFIIMLILGIGGGAVSSYHLFQIITKKNNK